MGGGGGAMYNVGILNDKQHIICFLQDIGNIYRQAQWQTVGWRYAAQHTAEAAASTSAQQVAFSISHCFPPEVDRLHPKV